MDNTTKVTVNARGYGSAGTAIRRAYPNSPILSIVKVAGIRNQYEATIIDREAK